VNLIFLGPPGAGKGTQAKVLEERFGYRQVSTGDILRANRRDKTALGLEAQSYMDRGALVPDDVIIRMMEPVLDAAGNVILDGFPRTVAQAQALDDVLRRKKKSAVAVLFDVDPDVLTARLTARWTHEASGRTYNTIHKPPQVAGIDDVTGEPLMQRPDDKEETIRTRLAVYDDQTAPLIAYYDDPSDQRLVRVDALAPIESVTEQLVRLIKSDGFSRNGAPA
jgi:adenylate kinase